ncbi:MAG: hypothetical protein ABW051_08280, partial [Burkholderiaceae bacterium]
ARRDAERKAARETADAAAAPPMEAGAPAPAARPAPSPAPSPAPAPAPAMAPPPPPPAPVAPRAEPGAARQSAPTPAPSMQATPAPSLPALWARLMLSSGGQLAVVQQGEKPALTTAMNRAAAATSREPFMGTVIASVGIADQSGMVGVLEASETHLRWLPRRAAAPAEFTGRPPQALMQELLAAIREAVPR